MSSPAILFYFYSGLIIKHDGRGERLVIIIVFIIIAGTSSWLGEAGQSSCLCLHSSVSVRPPPRHPRPGRVCKYPVSANHVKKMGCALWKCRNSEVNKTAANVRSSNSFHPVCQSCTYYFSNSVRTWLKVWENVIGSQFEEDTRNKFELKLIFVS